MTKLEQAMRHFFVWRDVGRLVLFVPAVVALLLLGAGQASAATLKRLSEWLPVHAARARARCGQERRHDQDRPWHVHGRRHDRRERQDSSAQVPVRQ